MKIVAGIDVSKPYLDVWYMGKHRRFRNTKAGHLQLLKWAKEAEPFVMEATGAYHFEIAQFLSEQGRLVSVVNPAQASHFARAMGKRSKTDQIDAQTLAEFGARFEMPVFAALSQTELELRRLARFRTDLVDQRASLKTRLKDPVYGEFERESLRALVTTLSEQIDKVDASLRQLVAQTPELKARQDALLTIPGVGEVISLVLMSELVHPERFAGAKQVAAFAGICPRLAQSGKSQGHGVLSRQGNSRIRRFLYLAAMAAIRSENPFLTFYERLQPHKAKMTAMVAVMHKMLRVCYAVMKTGSPFIPERALTKSN